MEGRPDPHPPSQEIWEEGLTVGVRRAVYPFSPFRLSFLRDEHGRVHGHLAKNHRPSVTTQCHLHCRHCPWIRLGDPTSTYHRTT